MHAFESYVRAAEGRGGRWRLWRLIPGIMLIAIAWIGWTALVLGAVVGWQMLAGAEFRAAMTGLQALMESGQPKAVVLMLATFIGIWPGVWLALRLLYGRRFGTVLSPEGSYRWRQFASGLGVAVAFYLISVVLASLIGGAPARTDLPLTTWLLWMPVIGLFVFFQASGEELIFRGYLTQELARASRHPFVWAVLPSALFGALHFSPGLSLEIGLLYVLATFLMGIAFAILVYQTGGLPAAMGLHTGLNICGLTLVGLEGIISGAQLFLYPPENEIPLFLADIAVSVALLAFLISPLSPFRRPSHLAAPAE